MHSETTSDAENKNVCSFCNKKYKTSSGLWKHSKTCNHTNDSTINLNTCGCGKKYATKSGLWKHLKKCDAKSPQTVQPSINAAQQPSQMVTNEHLAQAIMDVMKQNKEIQTQMLEIAKDSKPHIINNNNNFNLNVFLNEQCKDALNMIDFVKSLHLQLSDLEETGRLGHSDGISRIFVNGLKVLDINKRPIHCSDLKRETLYIKEGNVWEKDNENKLIKRAISQVESKNISQIPLWVKTYPECADGNSRENTKYLKMVIQSTGGNLNNGENNINKIIKNIAKEVVIDKDKLRLF